MCLVILVQIFEGLSKKKTTSTCVSGIVSDFRGTISKKLVFFLYYSLYDCKKKARDVTPNQKRHTAECKAATAVVEDSLQSHRSGHPCHVSRERNVQRSRTLLCMCDNSVVHNVPARQRVYRDRPRAVLSFPRCRATWTPCASSCGTSSARPTWMSSTPVLPQRVRLSEIDSKVLFFFAVFRFVLLV